MGESAEKISFPIEAPGGEEAAKAYDNTAAAMDRAVKVYRSLKDAQNQSGFLARVAEYRAEAAAVNGLEPAFKRAAESSQVFSTAMKAANTNAINFREKAGAAGAVLSQMAVSLNEIAPAAAGANTVFGTMFRTLSPLLGVIGTGGVGLAAGGIIAALTGLGAAMNSSAKEADALAKKAMADAIAVQTLDEKIAALKGKSGDAFKSDPTLGDVDALRQQRSKNMQALVDSEKAMREAIGVDSVEAFRRQKAALDSENRSIETRIRLLEKRAAAEKEIREAAALDAAGLDAAGRQNAIDKERLERILTQRTAAGKRFPTLDFGQQDTKTGKMKESDEALLAFLGEGDSKSTILTDRWKYEQDQYDEAEKWRMQRVHDETEWKNAVFQKELDDRNALKEKETAFYIAQEEKKRAADEQTKQQAIAGLQVYANTAGQLTAHVIQQALAGQKIQLSGLLASIGQQMIAEGTMAGFSGAIRAAFSYGTDGSAYVMMAEGAAEVAAGIALSVAAGPTALKKAAGAQPSSGGGYGGVGTSPIRPFDSQGGSVVNNVYIEWTSPFAPSAEDGMRIRQSLQMADWTHPRS